MKQKATNQPKKNQKKNQPSKATFSNLKEISMVVFKKREPLQQFILMPKSSR